MRIPGNLKCWYLVSFCDCRKSGSVCLCKRLDLSARRCTLSPSVTGNRIDWNYCMSAFVWNKGNKLFVWNQMRDTPSADGNLCKHKWRSGKKRSIFKYRWKGSKLIPLRSLWRSYSIRKVSSENIRMSVDTICLYSEH